MATEFGDGLRAEMAGVKRDGVEAASVVDPSGLGRGLPTRALLWGVVLTLVLVAGGVGVVRKLIADFKGVTTIELRLSELAGTIVHLDEVLTMSARMAATTGHPEWEARYRHFEPLLDAALKETMALAPEARSGAAARQTDAANIALVAMEHEALDLVRSGNQAAAARLLFSESYKARKEIYAAGMKVNVGAIQTRIRHMVGAQRKLATAGSVLAFAIVLALLACWLRAGVLIHRHLLARGAAELAMREADERRRAQGELRDTISRERESAARDQLGNVGNAVAGLPLVAYEVAGDHADGTTARWVVGDVEGALGMTRHEFMRETNWLARVHPDDRERLQEAVRRAVEGPERRYTMRFRLRVRGEYRWRVNAASYDPVRRCRSGIAMDVHEQMVLQEQLLQAQKMDAIGHLAAGIAHDFNNLLAVILSYATLIRDEVPAGAPPFDDAVEVLHAAERASALTRQLLTFSRQQLGVKKPIDLNRSIVQLQHLLARTVGARIVLHVSPSERPAVVEIDPVQFDQVVLNLVVNARDAMPEGGSVRIAVELDPKSPPSMFDGSVARVVVTDTGTGMDEATKARLFEPFFTTKEKGKGTGLGLATCFGVVRDAGGGIRVESDPGKGTTFLVDLPRSDRAPNSLAPESKVIHRGEGEIVLLAEDESPLRHATARVLERAGYKVHLASDGNDALRMLDQLGSLVAAVVTDVVMPGCDGYAVAAHAERRAPNAAVLLTSGYRDEHARRGPGQDLPILWKPVPPDQLERNVSDAIEARRKNACARAISTA